MYTPPPRTGLNVSISQTLRFAEAEQEEGYLSHFSHKIAAYSSCCPSLLLVQELYNFFSFGETGPLSLLLTLGPAYQCDSGSSPTCSSLNTSWHFYVQKWKFHLNIEKCDSHSILNLHWLFSKIILSSLVCYCKNNDPDIFFFLSRYRKPY